MSKLINKMGMYNLQRGRRGKALQEKHWGKGVRTSTSGVIIEF